LERTTKLPAPPAITCADARPRPPGGRTFLDLRRITASCAYPGGETSEPFLYDVVERRAPDAVVIVPTFRAEGTTWVVLRSAVRIPFSLRDPELGNVWELPAGLVEGGESVEEAGARELLEEAGAHVEPSALRRLGPPVVPAPGIIAEIQHFVVADIDPEALVPPEEDGSPLERHAHVVAVPLEVALRDLGAHGLVDAKTELALRRLADTIPPERRAP
jgi:ADP-ribose pyrophosphatase